MWQKLFGGFDKKTGPTYLVLDRSVKTLKRKLNTLWLVPLIQTQQICISLKTLKSWVENTSNQIQNSGLES